HLSQVTPLRLRGLSDRLERAWADRQLRRTVDRVESYLAASADGADSGQSPVVFFNASTRIHTLSLNAAYSLLTSWGLRARGIPVKYLVCHRAMEQCILGTNRQDLQAPPPCSPCIYFSELLFPPESTLRLPLAPAAATAVRSELRGLSADELAAWQHQGYPLGELILPSVRWALRRHHLDDDPATRGLYSQYLRSAASLVDRLQWMLDRLEPAALVLFNGVTYPEAVAWAVARSRGISVVTHEVGLKPQSAFFSHDHATFREIDLPPGFELSQAEEEALNRYLVGRRQGQFTMAGIRFWPSMQELPARVQDGLDRFEQTVAIFTNVIFDTSQIHANVLFDDMFDWLDSLVPLIQSHPKTLFVLRAHPDENRPGKESQENVADWYRDSPICDVDNVIFLPPDDYVSSYQLIERAKFVLVFNSSIGLEASIMGSAVLSAGRARYTQADTVFMPSSRSRYLEAADRMLAAEALDIPAAHQANARRFLYRELHHASLDFSPYLRPYPSMAGMVLFSEFEPTKLVEDPLFQRLRAGIIDGDSFVAPSRKAA
ncbi:MAG: hypothetical protein WBR18_08580, partial [Anaerolineales bacterium]